MTEEGFPLLAGKVYFRCEKAEAVAHNAALLMQNDEEPMYCDVIVRDEGASNPDYAGVWTVVAYRNESTKPEYL